MIGRVGASPRLVLAPQFGVSAFQSPDCPRESRRGPVPDTYRPADAAPRRLAAIMAADIEGFSRLMGADEDGTVARVTAQLRELAGPVVEAHGGRIFKTMGDGFL